MDSDLSIQLKNLGLQPNEANVYLALLELGKGTVTEISQQAKLNRTTGYDILERLCLYSLANRSISEPKKRVYMAEPPSMLVQFLENRKRQAERRMEELKKFLPGLQSLFKTDLKPAIKFAQGKKEMDNLYLHVLDSKSTVYSILNLKGYAEIFDELGVYQSEELAKRGIKEKVLAIKSEFAVAWHDKIYKGKPKRQKMTEYRWLEGYENYDTAGEVNIFDDKVIGMLSKPGENAAFEIKSQTFADFLKIIFEIAWKEAEKER